MIGKVVNYRYEILEKAGDGSLYAVYKARDKVLNRLVAVKILHSNYAANKDFGDRLTAEVQNTQDLVHPSIARMYEADQQDGVYFTAVEFVRGINLKDRIRRTAPFTISYAVDIAAAVCEALDYAHKSGTVHGDVRPHNILTSAEGQVKLTDFGLAAAISAFPVMKDNTLLRSVHYTAPEVLRGNNPQAVSDIYSLGIVLFEMVTGSVPFDAETSMAIAAKHLADPPPVPHEINPAVPKALSDVIIKAMEKNPSGRYQSAEEMLADLRQIKEMLRVGGPLPKAGREATATAKPVETEYINERPEQDLRHTLIVLLGIFVLAVLIGVGIMAPWRLMRPPRIQVPDLLGKRVEEAEVIARQVGIQLVDYHEDYNDRYHQGEIYMTNPAPGGMVSRDDPRVKIWVSRGPRLTEVPDLVGLSQEDATKKIAEAGFVVGKINSEYNDNTEVGRVIRQKPNSGENREPRSPIELVVSQGERPEPPTPTAPNGEPAPTSEQRQFDIKIDVPEDLPDPQVVKILISDDVGQERVAYEEPRQPGESFTQQIVGFGDKVEIRVFVGDRELWRQEY